MPGRPSAPVLALGETDPADADGIELVAGSRPAAGEVMVDDRTAQRFDIEVGETVTATAKVKQKDFNGPGKNWVQVLVEGKDSTGSLIGFAEVGYNLPD